jgi:hypothetical protein
MPKLKLNDSPEAHEYRRHHHNAAGLLDEALREVERTLESPKSHNAITDHIRRALVLCEDRAGLR